MRGVRNTYAQTHGHRANGEHSPMYNTWRGMKERYNNSRHTSYQFYGAVGITVRKDWNSFSRFLADMGERP